jgi:hypothetical protein
LYNNSTEYTAAKGNFDEVFGAAGGVNTKIRNQLSQAKGTLEGIASKYLDSSGNPTNCTKTITTADTGFKVPFFGETTTSATLFATSYPDTGKYTCYVYDNSGGNDTSLAFGKEAITSPSTGCTDAFKYYVAYGYSIPGTSIGHQIQKFFYNGCTGDIAVAMAIASTADTTVTNGTSQGFNARFELTGNVNTYAFEVRTFKQDMYSATDGYTRIEAKGVTQVASGNGYFRAKSKNCSSNGSGGSETCSAGQQDYCIKVSTTEGDYTVVTDATEAATNCDVVTVPTQFTYSELGKTPVAMKAAAFGL